ncbi:MAG: twin-arginine translocation signal domain-containing protein [Betaproteobacteria bacterium]|nr:MAG: twin-arginine translocation signal domain-containing protein [Betaproteobacteria bacterium]
MFQVLTMGRRLHMKNYTRSKLSRRNFLIAAGVGGATAAAIAGRALTPNEPKALASNDKRRGKGYQDTAHVRSYYNTAKV